MGAIVYLLSLLTLDVEEVEKRVSTGIHTICGGLEHMCLFSLLHLCMVMRVSLWTWWGCKVLRNFKLRSKDLVDPPPPPKMGILERVSGFYS